MSHAHHVCRSCKTATVQHLAYTSDLLALEAHINRAPPTLPEFLYEITTPLDVKVWAQQLEAHPDQIFAQYFIRHGFWIGFTHCSHKCSPVPVNHPSAMEHPDVISECLEAKTFKGCLVGPLDSTLFPFVQISSLGAVPKKHSDSKWRPILDLSHPKGSSVNDGIICSIILSSRYSKKDKAPY